MVHYVWLCAHFAAVDEKQPITNVPLSHDALSRQKDERLSSQGEMPQEGSL